MKKNIPLLMSAIIIAFSMTGCFGTPKPWVDSGFTKKHSTSAYYEYNWEKWEKNGFGPQEAKAWIDAGTFRIFDAIRWKKAGFIPSQYKEWRNTNYRNYPYNLKEVNSIVKLGFTLKDAQKVPLGYYLGWTENGLTNEDIIAWAELKDSKGIAIFKANEYESVKKLKKKGIKPKDYESWYNVGVHYISDIELASKNSLSINEYQKWKQDGVKDIEDIIKLVKENISAKKYASFKNIKVNNMDSIIAWSKTNLKLSKIKKYHMVDSEIISNHKKLNKVLKACPDGINAVNESTINDFSPFKTEGKCFQYFGKITQSISNNSLAIKALSSCTMYTSSSGRIKVPFHLCLSAEATNRGENTQMRWNRGRISIFEFKKLIPDNLRTGELYVGLVKVKGPKQRLFFGNTSINTEVIYPLFED